MNAATHLLNDQDELETMGEAAASLGIRDADTKLAQFVLDAAKQGAAR